VLGRDKALSKKILSYHRIRVPRFSVFRKGRAVARPRALTFPLIVKSLTEDASAGIAEASVVQSEDKLAERVDFVHQNLGTHAIVEEYIDGRETYVGLLGHRRLRVLPTWELFMENLRPAAPRIFTLRAKWDTQFQRAHGFRIGAAVGFGPEQEQRMARLARRIYRALNLSGYARLDFRLDPAGQPYFLEANPNPDLASDAELAQAASAAGMSYEQLIHQILMLGQRSLPA
jgi:D-alanine-D-alanine ligase